jgi:hypothetical protein
MVIDRMCAKLKTRRRVVSSLRGGDGRSGTPVDGAELLEASMIPEGTPTHVSQM